MTLDNDHSSPSRPVTPDSHFLSYIPPVLASRTAPAVSVDEDLSRLAPIDSVPDPWPFPSQQSSHSASPLRRYRPGLRSRPLPNALASPDPGLISRMEPFQPRRSRRIRDDTMVPTDGTPAGAGSNQGESSSRERPRTGVTSNQDQPSSSVAPDLAAATPDNAPNPQQLSATPGSASVHQQVELFRSMSHEERATFLSLAVPDRGPLIPREDPVATPVNPTLEGRVLSAEEDARQRFEQERRAAAAGYERQYRADLA